MDAGSVIYNVCMPLIAYALLAFSANKAKDLIGIVFSYFLIGSVVIGISNITGFLISSGRVYFILYSLFAALFVLKLCILATKSTTMAGSVPPFLCALLLFLIYMLNVGVHYESGGALWGMYFIVMIPLEVGLLGICTYSSRILHGFVRFLVHRVRSGNNFGDNHRCVIIDRSIPAYKRHNKIKSK